MGKCHFIGIGGIGMSGLARILLSKKEHVTGSDMAAGYVIEGLEQAGAIIYKGHSSQHITPDMTVVYTTDIKKDNPEYLAALTLKCPLLHRSDLLVQLMSEYKTLAVAGTHGKTTTSALLAAVLMESGFDPSFAVGGILPQFQSNARHGDGKYFVAEADESDGSFLKYHPWGGVVTNIDGDHLDYYKTEEAIDEAFAQFLEKVQSPDHLFVCGDDLRLSKIAKKGIRYGFSPLNDVVVSKFRQEGWRIFFTLKINGRKHEEIEASLTGRHNALNAAAVFALALQCGASEEKIRIALKNFQGIKRRSEHKGYEKGILVLDDYAHHPTEAAATLSAVRKAVGGKRLIAIFQPHRYSRTRDCLGHYKKCFDEADLVVITDIYGAGETPIEGVDAGMILTEVQLHSKTPACYVQREELFLYLKKNLRPHDVVVTLGAGDITKFSAELVNFIRENPLQKYKIGVIDGGRSIEYEVSKMSSENILAGLNSGFYEISHFHITKEGTWQTQDSALAKDALSEKILNKVNECEVFFPVLHGRYGEDGTIQGFFEILNKPYVGCDYRSAAIAMDKAITKHLMISKGIPTLPFIDFSLSLWRERSKFLLNEIESRLSLPTFVKPVHLGSSIGVAKVESFAALVDAIENAFRFDNHLIVENGVVARELEFAVLGNSQITVFPPGEICTEGKIYDYDGKYSKNGTRTESKAHLPPELIEEGKFLAEAAYMAIGCSGMARVDFFLDSGNKYWLNEINPIPGFTCNSLYPAICGVNGLAYPDLLDRLVILALERARQNSRFE